MQPGLSQTLSFKTLVTEAAKCTRCASMCERSAVLSDLNGPLEARILFIGEAPGRKGADRTRIPFSGDQSGKNFDRFLAAAGLTRDQIFVTSAALCNPRTASGANRKPTSTELLNCSYFLERIIQLLNPKVIVTLGSVALDALKRIHHHQVSLKEHVATVHQWQNHLLIPLYHPSPQVLASHRREADQLRDYQALSRSLQQTGDNGTSNNPKIAPRG